MTREIFLSLSRALPSARQRALASARLHHRCGLEENIVQQRNRLVTEFTSTTARETTVSGCNKQVTTFSLSLPLSPTNGHTQWDASSYDASLPSSFHHSGQNTRDTSHLEKLLHHSYQSCLLHCSPLLLLFPLSPPFALQCNSKQKVLQVKDERRNWLKVTFFSISPPSLAVHLLPIFLPHSSLCSFFLLHQLKYIQLSSSRVLVNRCARVQKFHLILIHIPPLLTTFIVPLHSSFCSSLSPLLCCSQLLYFTSPSPVRVFLLYSSLLFASVFIFALSTVSRRLLSHSLSFFPSHFLHLTE